MMLRWLERAGLALICTFFLAAAAQSQERVMQGQARLFNNDLIGDGEDRWRSGSYWVSLVRAPEWQGALPTDFGRLIELRFRGEVIAPANLTNPDPMDRPYAGALSFGVHTHFQRSGYEFALGADLVAMGEQTGLRRFHAELHDLFGLSESNVENMQVENGVYLHGTAEVARSFALGPETELRPFLELQAGVETLARVGFDLTFGGYGQGGLRLRDVTTGHRISAIDGMEDHGFSFLLGGDVAWVHSSRYLPEDIGYELEDQRYRLRAGMNYAVGASNMFYGLTYLSEEFSSQPEGQVIGSLTLDIAF